MEKMTTMTEKAFSGRALMVFGALTLAYSVGRRKNKVETEKKYHQRQLQGALIGAVIIGIGSYMAFTK